MGEDHSIGWIVPVTADDGASGYALFNCEPDTYHVPELWGIYESIEEAKADLREEGAIHDP